MEYPNSLTVVPLQTPTIFIVLFVVVIFIVMVRVALSGLSRLVSGGFRKRPTKLSRDCIELRPFLLTKGENAFLPALEQAIGNQLRIMMKVRLGDLVNVRGNGSIPTTLRNKTNQKHIDFVLCTHYPVQPLLAIELDDASHDRIDRQERDGFVEECLARAGLPILHVRCQQAYDVRQLAADIQAYLVRKRT